MVVNLSAVPVQLAKNTVPVSSVPISVWGYVGFACIMLTPVFITLSFFYRNRIKAFFLSKLKKEKFFYAVFRYPNKQKVTIPAVIGVDNTIKYAGGTYMIQEDAFTFEKKDLLSPTVAYQEWFKGDPRPIVHTKGEYSQNDKTINEVMNNKFIQELAQGKAEKLIMIISLLLNIVILVFLIYSKYAGGVPK
jgi:hypothetical protein